MTPANILQGQELQIATQRVGEALENLSVRGFAPSLKRTGRTLICACKRESGSELLPCIVLARLQLRTRFLRRGQLIGGPDSEETLINRIHSYGTLAVVQRMSCSLRCDGRPGLTASRETGCLGDCSTVSHVSADRAIALRGAGGGDCSESETFQVKSGIDLKTNWQDKDFK